jgi:hypothetical protein
MRQKTNISEACGARNKSGTPSLRVSNDRQYYRGGEEQMWRIEPGKTPKLCSRAEIRVQWPDGDQSPPTACSPTRSWSWTARSRRPPIGIRGGRARAPAKADALRSQLAITSFTCMIGSIFV